MRWLRERKTAWVDIMFIALAMWVSGGIVVCAHNFSALLVTQFVLMVVFYSLAVFTESTFKKYLFGTLAYLIFFWSAKSVSISVKHFSNAVFSIPLIFTFISSKPFFALSISLVNMYLYSGFDLPHDIMINNLISLGCSSAGQVIIFRLIRQVQQDRNKFRELSIKDDLTGLFNRRGFMEEIRKRFRIVSNTTTGVGLIYIDLNRFKSINDSLGHAIGDALLQQVADVLRKVFSENSVICRMGGDEFVIYLERASKARIKELISSLCNILTWEMCVQGYELSLSASMGISMYPEDSADLNELMQNADIAMYYAKRQELHYLFYSPDMGMDKKSKILEHDLIKALRQNEFYLMYQPQFDIATGRLLGSEALIRWNSPEYGLVSTPLFISIAEESRFIMPLGQWILEEACRQNKQWQLEGYPPISIAVNVSVSQMLKPDFPNIVEKILLKTGLDPNYLVIELVENLFAYPKEISTVLFKLKALGVKVALDDFGAGYSSFSYIKDYPLDYLKIDKNFIKGVGCNPKDETIVSTLVNMARHLGLTVIAEGVENKKQLSFLGDIRCHLVQGYYTGKPCENGEFKERYLGQEFITSEGWRQVSVARETS